MLFSQVLLVVLSSTHEALHRQIAPKDATTIGILFQIRARDDNRKRCVLCVFLLMYPSFYTLRPSGRTSGRQPARSRPSAQRSAILPPVRNVSVDTFRRLVDGKGWGRVDCSWWVGWVCVPVVSGPKCVRLCVPAFTFLSLDLIFYDCVFWYLCAFRIVRRFRICLDPAFSIPQAS